MQLIKTADNALDERSEASRRVSAEEKKLRENKIKTNINHDET